MSPCSAIVRQVQPPHRQIERNGPEWDLDAAARNEEKIRRGPTSWYRRGRLGEARAELDERASDRSPPSHTCSDREAADDAVLSRLRDAQNHPLGPNRESLPHLAVDRERDARQFFASFVEVPHFDECDRPGLYVP